MPSWATGFLMLVAGPCAADDPAAVLDRATLFGNAPQLLARVVMQIEAPAGTKQRELDVSLRRREDSRLELLMRVVSPAFLSEMSYLSSRDADGRENRWLKTSRGVRKLSQVDRGEGLFDSDFTVADVSELTPEEYVLSSVGTEVEGGVTCDVVDAASKGSAGERRRIWVERQGGLLRRVDISDSSGRLLRRYLLGETQRIGGQPFPLVCTMETPATRSKTTLSFRSIRTDVELPDRLFSRGSL